MSTTTKKQELKPKAPISNRPTLQQLIAYYPSLSYTKVVKYRDYVLKECPDPINDSRDRFRNFVEKQFVQFMRLVGLPDGYKKEDIPFLKGVDIHE